MLTLLDRYIAKRLLDYFFLGIVIFTLVLFFSDALLDFMKALQHYGIPGDIALALVGLQVPRIVSMVIPMSALLSTLMVYNSLNNQFEITAMRMSGVSLYRLALPAVLLGVGACLFSYLLNDYMVPTCNKYARALKSYAINQQNLPANQENFTYKHFDKQQQLKRLIYVSRFDKKTLGYTTVIDLTNPKTMQIVQARSGQWGSQSLLLKDANVYTVSANQKLSNTTQAQKLELQHFIQPEKQVSEFKPKELSFLGLNAWIKYMENKGLTMPAEVFVALWEKLTMPLSSLPLVLIAMPLALTSPRKLSNLGFLTAIAIIFLYYLIRHISVQLGEHGLLPPLLAAAMPLLIITSVALGLFHRKNRVL